MLRIAPIALVFWKFTELYVHGKGAWRSRSRLGRANRSALQSDSQGTRL